MNRLGIMVLFLSALVSCNQKESPDFTRFEYRYHDSSVPPEYHRSYTIIMTTDSISKWVDSYGDTVSYEIKAIKKSDFQKLKNEVKEANLYHCPRNDNEGCSGGTGFSIYYYQNNKRIFKGSKWQCGGVYEGDLCGETDKILAFLSSFFKNTTE